jgi:hypothetical protein
MLDFVSNVVSYQICLSDQQSVSIALSQCLSNLQKYDN